MAKFTKTRVLRIVLLVCAALVVLAIANDFFRYPLRASLPDLTGIDPENCTLRLWHWGQEVDLTDPASREALLAVLSGTLVRGRSDRIGKSGGVDWVLKLSAGTRSAQVILRTGDPCMIQYGAYTYTVEHALPPEAMDAVFAANGGE